VVDPHTAVGLCATAKQRAQLNGPIVNLACAHPAKFPEIILAELDVTPNVPDFLALLLQKPERTTIVDPDSAVIRDLMEKRR
jgi:threonine synthase